MFELGPIVVLENVEGLERLLQVLKNRDELVPLAEMKTEAKTIGRSEQGVGVIPGFFVTLREFDFFIGMGLDLLSTVGDVEVVGLSTSLDFLGTVGDVEVVGLVGQEPPRSRMFANFKLSRRDHVFCE